VYVGDVGEGFPDDVGEGFPDDVGEVGWVLEVGDFRVECVPGE
jgi:hypothetical protein